MAEFKSHKGLFVRNILWGNLNTILRYVLAFVATSFLARTFLPDVFGTYQLVISYLTIFEAFFLVSPTHLRNYLAANPDKEATVSALWFWQNIFVFLFVVVACAIGTTFSNESSFWVLLLIASIRFMFRFNDYVAIVCDQRLLNYLAQQIAIVQNVSLSILRILAALFKTNIFLLCLTSPIQGLCSAYHQYKIATKFGIKFSTRISIAEFVGIFRGGFFISLLSFLSVFQSRVVSVALAEYLTKENFGNFQLVIKLIEPATMLGMIIIGANYSVLANSLQHNAKLFNIRYAKIAGLTLMISLVLSLAIYVTPINWLVIFFGEQYAHGLSFLSIAALLVLANTLVWIDQNYDFLKQEYRFALVKYLTMLAMYILAVFYFNTRISIEIGLWVAILVPTIVSGASLIFRLFNYYRFL